LKTRPGGGHFLPIFGLKERKRNEKEKTEQIPTQNTHAQKQQSLCASVRVSNA